MAKKGEPLSTAPEASIAVALSSAVTASVDRGSRLGLRPPARCWSEISACDRRRRAQDAWRYRYRGRGIDSAHDMHRDVEFSGEIGGNRQRTPGKLRAVERNDDPAETRRSAASSSVARTISTGTVALRVTRSATLPKMARPMAPRPWLAMAIMSALRPRGGGHDLFVRLARGHSRSTSTPDRAIDLRRSIQLLLRGPRPASPSPWSPRASQPEQRIRRSAGRGGNNPQQNHRTPGTGKTRRPGDGAQRAS